MMANKRVFIVEDEAILLCDLEDFVQGLGYGLAGSATNLKDAMQQLDNGPLPDIALLDLNLNGTPSDAIADFFVKAGVPVIFISGYGRRGLPERFNRFEVIQKPYDEARLASALAQATVETP